MAAAPLAGDCGATGPVAGVDAPFGFDAEPVAVDVPPESGGTVFPRAVVVTLPGVALPGVVVELPGVALPVVTPGFPVGEVAAAPAGELFAVAGVQGTAVGVFGVGGGMIGGIFAGLPVGVGCPGAVVDGVWPGVVDDGV